MREREGDIEREREREGGIERGRKREIEREIEIEIPRFRQQRQEARSLFNDQN